MSYLVMVSSINSGPMTEPCGTPQSIHSLRQKVSSRNIVNYSRCCGSDCPDFVTPLLAEDCLCFEAVDWAMKASTSPSALIWVICNIRVNGRYLEIVLQLNDATSNRNYEDGCTNCVSRNQHLSRAYQIRASMTSCYLIQSWASLVPAARWSEWKRDKWRNISDKINCSYTGGVD